MQNPIDHPFLRAENIAFESEGYELIDKIIAEIKPTKTFILVDSNTSALLPKVIPNMTQLDPAYEILEVDPGEQSKSLEIAAGLWDTLREYGADRKSLLINLGGGMITDLGGFIASTYQRGITFCNIPTSLLAMVDASVGGKTGINFSGLKNQIGTFQRPRSVAIVSSLLQTLPDLEWTSGHGEMIKHALISGAQWPNVLWFNRNGLKSADIARSILVKAETVQQDFKEQGARRLLNLGHTFGHAWEMLHAHLDRPIPHGLCVIQGLHLALHLSGQDELRAELSQRYPWNPVSPEHLTSLWELQRSDKKSEAGQVQFVLLEDLGKATWGNSVDRDEWEEALLELNEDCDLCMRF